MRRKLRNDSTMKTITYGLFIYVFLTTSYGIFATGQQHDAKPNTGSISKISHCELPNVIQRSKYAHDCLSRTSNGTESIPEPNVGNVVPYLCAGIFETANRICELNVDISSINLTTFETEITRIESVAKNRITFCSALKNLTLNPSYYTEIDSNAHPGIVSFTKNLISECNTRLCWNTLSTNSANSLCTLLYWENSILAETLKILKSNVPAKVELKTLDPAKSTQDESQQGSKLGDEKTEGSIPNLNTNRSNPSPNEHKAEQEAKKIPKPPVPKVDAGEAKSPPITKQNPAMAEPQIHLESETKPKGKSDVMDGAGSRTMQGSEHGVENQEKPPMEGKETNKDVANEGPENKKTELIIGSEGKSDIGIDENDSRIGDDEDDQEQIGPDSFDVPPVTEKKISASSSNAAPASANAGKEHNSAGQAKSETNQESVAPRDHSLSYSGPLDPPQHFFAYFMAVSFICLICYVGYHKKHKIMGIIFEGRKSRGGRGRRRPNTAGYRKLDCNLEEAVTSQCNSNVTHVIY